LNYRSMNNILTD